MTFRVGQKVVCVNDGPSRFFGTPTTVKKGEVYTILRTGFHKRLNEPYVILAEVDPPGEACGFDVQRFRPIVDRKTDISIFTKMLKSSRVEA